MTASRLTDGTYELWLAVVAKLEGMGYPFNAATTSVNAYLATALRGIAGGAATERNTGFAQLLAATVVALGGIGNVSDQNERELMARIANASGGGGGGGGGYQGPLDLVSSGVVVAYSQRALAAAWTSAAITIRRDSDDATQSFATNVSNAVDAAAISAFIGGGSGFAATWKDQSGNARDAVQATPAAQPEWKQSATGLSVPGLDFTVGGVRVLSTAADVSLTSGKFTTFAVCNMINNAHGDELCGINYESGGNPPTQPGWFALEFSVSSATNYCVYIDISDGTNGDLKLAQNADPGTALLGFPVVYDTSLDGTADISGQNVKLNGTTQSFNSTTFPSPPVVGLIKGPFNVGSDDTLANSFECFFGEIIELLIYDGSLSAPDRLAVRQNIAAYYGITLA